MLVNMNEVLLPAKKGGYGVGFFNAVNVEMARAVIGAAEELRAPVMVGTGARGGISDSDGRESICSGVCPLRSRSDLCALYAGAAPWIYVGDVRLLHGGLRGKCGESGGNGKNLSRDGRDR